MINHSALLVILLGMIIFSPAKVAAQSTETYTSRWTVEKWMNANMRYGNDDSDDHTGTDRTLRSLQGDHWTRDWHSRRFTLGPASWKAVTNLGGGSTTVCEKWRLTSFRSNNDSDDTNVYAEKYEFPNDDTERLVQNERLDGNSVLIYGDETSRGNERYIPDRWRLERSESFYRRHWVKGFRDTFFGRIEESGTDLVGSPGSYGLTILESAGWHASNTVDTDFDEVLVIFPTEWTVSGYFDSSDC